MTTHDLTVAEFSEPLRRPAMVNQEDARPGLALTNRSLAIEGVPTIPISGEIHYSRVPRARWRERLELMAAGGITVVATYVIWLHHVPTRGEPDFTGNLDLGAFVDLCAEVGLDVVLRIGPWCHGEARNGGFPDWVQQADVEHRTDDPAYLALAAEWYAQIGSAVADRCGPSGPILGIQLDNELYDQPGHLATLKRLARDAGLHAPIWTATAWGGAQLPLPEVMPLFGGYGDGFWVDSDAGWDPTFRSHYSFTDIWDDPGIGADVRTAPPGSAAVTEPGTWVPPATCELGGGMATTYHRRNLPTALDVAAVAHTKIGNGSAWQGYYMYAGGTNPRPNLQESHATGYPNDLPGLSYDFHAPIGEAGLLAPSHAELRRQHAFLAAFGDLLATWPSTTTPRWAYRGDGDHGVLFIAWHQPHYDPLPPSEPLRFRLRRPSGSVTLPSAAVSIPPGTLARWPVGLQVGGVRIDWATASLLTVLDAPDGVPTLVLSAHPGLAPEIAVDGVAHPLEPGLAPARLTQAGAELDVLVLDAEQSEQAWVRETPERTLYLSPATLRWSATGPVRVTGGASTAVERYDTARRAFIGVPLEQHGAEPREGEVGLELVRDAVGPVPTGYGQFRNRESAPTPDRVESHAAIWRLALPDWAAGDRTYLRIDWAGDLGELRVNGRAVSDRFWDGSSWWVNLADSGVVDGAEITLHLLPLSSRSTIHLPPQAQARRDDRDLLALDALTLVRFGEWTLA
ncbi:beta-galactosidase [Pseudactinotalea sp.]|uniref:beta-galactosidase n=1 Tax=Pseudactinotalea sp. TaxID=1926260 RepID=UPI003B3A64EB